VLKEKSSTGDGVWPGEKEICSKISEVTKQGGIKSILGLIWLTPATLLTAGSEKKGQISSGFSESGEWHQTAEEKAARNYRPERRGGVKWIVVLLWAAGRTCETRRRWTFLPKK